MGKTNYYALCYEQDNQIKYFTLCIDKSGKKTKVSTIIQNADYVSFVIQLKSNKYIMQNIKTEVTDKEDQTAIDIFYSAFKGNIHPIDSETKKLLEEEIKDTLKNHKAS